MTHIAQAALKAVPIVWTEPNTASWRTANGWNDSHRGGGPLGGTDRVDDQTNAPEPPEDLQPMAKLRRSNMWECEIEFLESK